MTLPLHKRRRTTARSTRQAITHKGRWTAGIVVLLCLLSVQVSSRLTAEENPLDQLRDRSAETRWKSLRERFAERRDERKDRRKYEDAELPVTGSEQNSDEGTSPRLQEMDSVPVPAPSASPVDLVPPTAPVAVEVQPAERIPVLQPVPNRAVEGTSQPAAPASGDLNSVSRALEAAGPLYQEVFQLELTPAAETDSSGSGVELSTGDPHPGMLSPREESTNKRNSTPVVRTQTVAMKEKVSDSMLMLPELPLPNTPPTEMRVSYQNRPLLSQPVAPVEKFVFSPDEYIKEIDDIVPFPDYEPNARQREKDPYHNLCDHPQRSDSPASQCPEVELMPHEREHYEARHFAHLEYAWVAPNICYNPLYFEDVNLERYGHYHNPVVQPFVSVGKFGAQFLGLPYQMVMKPPRMAVYPLGYLPPGDVCNPKLYYQIPFNAQAAMVTVGVYTGWFFLIP